MFVKSYSESFVPTRAYAADTGLDLRAALSQPLDIPPHKVVKIPTQVRLSIPYFPLTWLWRRIFPYTPVYDITLRSRSGLASKGIIVANSPATIDKNYTGEIFVLLANLTNEPFTIEPNQAIAQLVVQIALVPSRQMVGNLRAERGFGSSDSSSSLMSFLLS